MSRHLSERHLKLIIFVASFIVFSLCRSNVISLGDPEERRVYLFTGDEPQYCLIAHSLLFDGDFVIKNNVDQKDYRRFYPHRMTGHCWGIKSDMYSEHRVGLPLLIALPYYIGYRTGLGERAVICIFLNIVGALLAVNVFTLCCQWVQTRRAAVMASLAVCFTMPIIVYSSFMIYPGLPAALLLVFAFRKILAYREPSVKDSLLIGLSLAFLPWLHERYSLAPLVLAAFFMTRISFKKKGLVPFLAPLVVSAVVLAWYYVTLYGSPFPGFGYPASPRDRFEPIEGLFKGFLGFIFDRDFGLLIYSPVYILMLVGVLLSLRYFRKESLWLLILIAVLYFVPAFYVGWCWSTSPSPRFMVATVPLFGVFMAVAFERIERGSFKFLTYTLLTISLLVALYSIRYPHELYFRSAEGSYVLTEFMKTHHLLAIDRVLPSFAKGLSFAELPVIVWAGLIIALSLRYYHGHVKRESTVTSPTGSGQ